MVLAGESSRHIKMSSVTKTGITALRVANDIVTFRPGHKSDFELPPDLKSIVVKLYHPDLERITGLEPEHSLLLSSDDSSKNPLFCHGCVYLPEQDELLIMSDLLQTTNSSALPTILISRILLRRETDRSGDERISSVDWMKLRPPPIMPMPAGACRYKAGILYCSQGTMTPDSGGLWYMALGKAPKPILTSYFNKPFNSIQSVVEDTSGALWFTDASVGFELEIRPRPQLPNQVYRFDPQLGDLRVVADGFSRPMGIALSPDCGTLYVTDTGAGRHNGGFDPTRAATIYAFDVTQRSGSPFLTGRRVFAYLRRGIPTAVVCDNFGNVYAACADGVEIWTPGGRALGLLGVPGGCTSLCFGKDGELFIGAKQRLWKMKLQET
ncbi:calcium-dependent phosphotriesterase [Hypoxylon sp. NC1633]|nr:calcium-dependent phosphotriesterase [Hypoxylon sp. NC1633]